MIIIKWSLQTLAYTQLRLHNMNICFDIFLEFPLLSHSMVCMQLLNLAKPEMSIRTCGRKVQCKGTVSHTVILTRRVNHSGWNLTQAPRGRGREVQVAKENGSWPSLLDRQTTKVQEVTLWASLASSVWSLKALLRKHSSEEIGD